MSSHSRYKSCVSVQAQLEEGGGAEAAADLEAQITELMEESQALAEESLNKDEEIEVLEAQLARTNQALSDAQQASLRMSPEKLEKTLLQGVYCFS